METLIQELAHTQPEFAHWLLSREDGFARAVARGYKTLAARANGKQLETYQNLVREADQEGPALGQILAVHLVPVLKAKTPGLFSRFQETVAIMRQKGTYTLKSCLEGLTGLLEAGDEPAARSYLSLLAAAFRQELSYNQSLYLTHLLPRAVLKFAPQKRDWQIAALARVVRADFRLADPFLEGMEGGLEQLAQPALNAFIRQGLEKYEHQPELGRKFLSLGSRLGAETCTQMLVSVSLARIQPQLNRYLRARTGISLSVRPLSQISRTAQDPQAWVVSDGRFLYLPEAIDCFASQAENARMYKCLVKLESAHYEFDSFGFDLEKWAERCQVCPLPPDKNRHLRSDLLRFFERFPDPDLAADLFTIFEMGRIRMLLARSYPGLVRRYLPILQAEASQNLKSQEVPNLLDCLYARIGLDLSPLADLSRKFREPIETITRAFETVMAGSQAVEGSGELVFRCYDAISERLKQADGSRPSLHPPFGRKLRPDQVFAAHRETERIAEKIKVELDQNNLKAYKSDIKQSLIQNQGQISHGAIKELIRQWPGAQGASAENVPIDLSWLDLRRILGEAGFDNQRAAAVSGPAFWYPEWDHRLGDYLQDHVRVSETGLFGGDCDFYEKTLDRYAAQVGRIRHAFEMLKPEGLIRLRKWVEGDEFDYRAMIDFVIEKKAGIMPSDRLYIKRIKQQRDVAVLLLVDLSRSTANQVAGASSSVLALEKQAMVLFCEALGVVGDDFAIAGFSGTGRLGLDYFRIKDFGEAMDEGVKGRIAALSPQRSTRMGGALRHAAAQLKAIAARVKLLIVLGDGFPNDTDYKRDYAIADTRKAIAEARARDIHARAITVNLAMDRRLDDLYGSLHHNLISDVKELPDKLLRIYSALTR